MPDYTTNYNLKKPRPNEMYNIGDHNGNMDLLDGILKEGDSKDNTVTFTEATEDENIATGEKHSTLFGKILKSIKTARADLIAHKAESAKKHITESGTNENGRYIKFDDGTMICYGDKISSGENGEGEDHLYPATFTTSPAIVGEAHKRSSDNFSSLSVVDITYTSINLFRVKSHTITASTVIASINLPFSYIAIGGWK